MSYVAQFSNSGSGSTTLTIPFMSSIPVGSLLVLGVLSRRTTSPGTPWTIADTAGNDWAYDTGSLATAGTGVYIALYHCKVTTALNSGDSVTLTAFNPQACWTGAIAEFSDTMVSTEISTATANVGTATTSVSVGPMNTTQTADLMFGAVGLISTAAAATGTNGWTAGPLVSSSSGSDDRSVQLLWQYVSGGGSQTLTASLNTGTVWAGAMRGVYIGATAPSPTVTVWNGTQEVATTLSVWTGTQEVTASVDSIV